MALSFGHQALVNVLITGATGQLGKAFQVACSQVACSQVACSQVACSQSGITVSLASRQMRSNEHKGRWQVDITDRKALERLFSVHRFDYVLNAAAYTAVDQAEEDEIGAFQVNDLGAGLLAECCRDYGSRLIHFSTDYVFDGAAEVGYVESAPTHPVSAYGRSKLAGEYRVLLACPDALVFRISWLFGVYGRNFVKTMLNLARTRKQLRVVDDQRGGPTFAGDLAPWVLAFLGIGDEPSGQAYKPVVPTARICHVPTIPSVSWYEFACEIFRQAETLSLLPHSVEVIPVSSSEFPSKVKRPANSVLATEVPRVDELGPLSWRDGLSTCLHVWSQFPELLWYD